MLMSEMSDLNQDFLKGSQTAMSEMSDPNPDFLNASQRQQNRRFTS